MYSIAFRLEEQFCFAEAANANMKLRSIENVNGPKTTHVFFDAEAAYEMQQNNTVEVSGMAS